MQVCVCGGGGGSLRGVCVCVAHLHACSTAIVRRLDCRSGGGLHMHNTQKMTSGGVTQLRKQRGGIQTKRGGALVLPGGDIAPRYTTCACERMRVLGEGVGAVMQGGLRHSTGVVGAGTHHSNKGGGGPPHPAACATLRDRHLERVP